MKKPLAIGVDDYKKLIDNGYYYVDKTLLVKEIIDKKGEVNLFTRPRRFGKTLALSMLRTYFEREVLRQGETTDNRKYFEGRKILEAGPPYTDFLGRYPIIFLSLKSAKQPNFQMAYDCMKEEIRSEYLRHSYVLEGPHLPESEKKIYRAVLEQTAEKAVYATSIKFLSSCLAHYHNQKVIILIDEYDVPLENAYFRDFYAEMVDFLRSLFESALKTNESLEFAIITGCLRISKESIFTGLNNLKILSILNDSYAEHFGFTQMEVSEMLRFYGIEEKTDEVRQWYDGYLFGETEVYNPWSIVNYVDEVTAGDTRFPKAYWSNTSSNGIVRELIDRADAGTKQELEILTCGGMIEKPLYEDITYEDIHGSQDNLWNFLFFTGYLKCAKKRFENRRIYADLTIPNEEIQSIYEETIQQWFEDRIKAADRV